MSKTTLMARVWADLSAINVNEHVQKKGNLSYLSWTWAWSTLMSKYPESYYVLDDRTKEDGSVMVECVLTIHEGDEVATRTMWLPVMDHKNKAIINPTSRDISDARMRCLVKCLAMFGLGFYIYAGEDIPSAEKDAQSEPIGAEQAQQIADMLTQSNSDIERFLGFYGISAIEELPQGKFKQAHDMLSKKLKG
jgi:hypothetical protein